VPIVIDIDKWSVVDIGVAIDTLGICGIGYNSVGLDPAVKIRGVKARPVVHDSQGRLVALAGVGTVGWQGAGERTGLAIRQVAPHGVRVAGGVGGQRGAAQVVAVDIVYSHRGAHGNSPLAAEIGLAGLVGRRLVGAHQGDVVPILF
jgi:hypothetical protein